MKNSLTSIPVNDWNAHCNCVFRYKKATEGNYLGAAVAGVSAVVGLL